MLLGSELEISSYSFIYGENYYFKVEVPGYKQTSTTDSYKFVMEYGAVQTVALEPTGPWKVTFNLFRPYKNEIAKLYGISYIIADRYGNVVCAENLGLINTFSCEMH